MPYPVGSVQRSNKAGKRCLATAEDGLAHEFKPRKCGISDPASFVEQRIGLSASIIDRLIKSDYLIIIVFNRRSTQNLCCKQLRPFLASYGGIKDSTQIFGALPTSLLIIGKSLLLCG